MLDECQYTELLRQIYTKRKTDSDNTTPGTHSSCESKTTWNLQDGRLAMITTLTKDTTFQELCINLIIKVRGLTDRDIVTRRHMYFLDYKIPFVRDLKVENQSAKTTDNTDGRELGPTHGFQWRHYGAKYEGYMVNYKKPKWKGMDQIEQIIHSLNASSSSSSSSPSASTMEVLELVCSDTPFMADDTHEKETKRKDNISEKAHFYIDKVKGGIVCDVYQTKEDAIEVNLPYKITSYSLLVHMIAYLTGLKPQKLTYSVQYVSIHSRLSMTQLEQLIQKTANPTKQAFLKLVDTEDIAEVDDFLYDNFKVSYK